MHRSINLQNSIPDDIALTIASSLQVFDVCSLGSCSRFWREMCGSDCVWRSLFKNRWPEISMNQESDSNSKAWRALYIIKHNEMAGKVASVENFVERASAFESIEAENVIEALDTSQVSERQVCVQWWKLGRWFYGFRLRDEFRSRNISLGDLAACDEEVLGVLHRGAIHEVIRVQISVSKPAHISWSHQVTHG
ncbi:hypothetical protein ACS0TY_014292 [Phlomoides rotata]